MMMENTRGAELMKTEDLQERFGPHFCCMTAQVRGLLHLGMLVFANAMTVL